MKLFAAGVLTQLSVIVGAGPDAILCVKRGDVRRRDRNGLYVLAGSGRFESLINEPLAAVVEAGVVTTVSDCLNQRRNVFGEDHCALYIQTLTDRENVVYMSSNRPLNQLDQRLIALFCDKIAIGFENIYLYEQLLKAQEATVATLADIAETAQVDIDIATAASLETRSESLRIAGLAERIARTLHAGRQFRDIIDQSFLELIGLASMLHDVGNITVSDHILRKPGPLTGDERRIMQRHTVRGHALLVRACGMVQGLTYLELGAEIALAHHENFDGSGYPHGLAGKAIPLAARIAAVADSFDALVSERPYRPAIARDQAVTMIEAMAGSRFDPVVVAAFLEVQAAGSGA